MIFKKLLPREDNFFDKFNQHADFMVETARAFYQLVLNYNDGHLRKKYNEDVDSAEKAADEIIHVINKTLHQTFITPIDREQIHNLINAMDDVADLMQDSAESMALYNVKNVTEEIISLAKICLISCEHIRDAIFLLDKLNEKHEDALHLCEKIDLLEADADRVFRSALSKLFREETDSIEVVKLKSIYETIEATTDKCDDVSNIIEAIILENT